MGTRKGIRVNISIQIMIINVVSSHQFKTNGVINNIVDATSTKKRKTIIKGKTQKNLGIRMLQCDRNSSKVTLNGILGDFKGFGESSTIVIIISQLFGRIRGLTDRALNEALMTVKINRNNRFSGVFGCIYAIKSLK